MATYGTDLTTLNDAESGTWVELTNYASGGTPSADGDNFIQGVDCQSQTTGTKSGAVFSICFNNGSAITWTTGEVFLVWQYYNTGSNIATYANGGMRVAVHSSLTAGYIYYTGGSDRSPYPAGAWQNVAVDPESTNYDVTDTGGGNGGNYQYIGSLGNFTNAISKGAPHACDAIRYGRAEIYVTGTGANFTDMAQYNDYNDGTNGYNRFGLFEDKGGGTFLWKGLMSIGQTATSATFSDSNKSITIDDAAKTYTAFNKIEVHNASTSMTWSNISFFSLGTTSPGSFEMVDNATVSMTGCSFNSMGTFIFDTGATVTGCAWNGCGQVTHGGADFDSCSFAGYEGTAGTAYMTYAINADPDGEMDNCSFTKGTAATHAIEFDATNTPTTITLRGIDFSGYNAANGNNDSTLYFPSTTKSYTVNLIGCSGNISYRVGTGGSVTLVTNPVTFGVTVKDIDTQALVSDAQVLVEVANGTNYPYQASVTITGSGTTATVAHTAHGLATNDNVVIRGANEDVYNGAYQITVTGANAYTYTTNETIGTSPATGTITSTFAVINATTTGTGYVSDSRTYASGDQLITGKVRKATVSPFYREQPINNTIDSADGLSITVQLISDE
jgi:hypothetical protein